MAIRAISEVSPRVQPLCEADCDDGHDDQHRHQGTQQQARATPQKQQVCHRRHQPEAEHDADDAQLKREDDVLLHAHFIPVLPAPEMKLVSPRCVEHDLIVPPQPLKQGAADIALRVASHFANAALPVDGVDQAFLPRVDRQVDIRVCVSPVDQDRRSPWRQPLLNAERVRHSNGHVVKPGITGKTDSLASGPRDRRGGR